MHKLPANLHTSGKARCVSVSFLLSILFAGLSVIYSSDAQATPVVQIKASQSYYSLGNMVEYFEDQSGLLDIDAVRRQPESAWQKSTMTTPGFGFTQSAYWFRIGLETVEEQRRLLEVDYPLLDEITLYLFVEGELIQMIETGDVKPFADRPLKFREFILPLALPEYGEVSLYLRVKSAGAVEVPLNLWSANAFYEQDEKETAILGLFFGIILVMLLYNLFVYLRVYEPAYIYYVLYVGTFGMFMLSMTGWGYKYLWPQAFQFQQYNTALFITISGIFVCRFIHYFLDLPHNAPRIKLILNALVVILLVLLCLLPLTSYHTIVQAALAITFAIAMIALYSGIVLWRQGEVSARYFTIAWSTFLLAVLFATLEKFAVIATSHWAAFLLPLGMALEVTLLSLALGERINSEKQHRIKAQEEIIDVQEKHQRELEEKVNERTMELEEANAKLRLLASIDGLTGIYNRRHFYERATQSINVAKRYKRPISIIMLDIDLFKQVNDNYGHDVGDMVLKHVVATIRKTNRETDIFGRLGGEEFGTLLVEAASKEAALNVAERIRLAVEAAPLEYAGDSIGITVSQGVCAIDPTEPYLTIEQMLKIADNALYQAKETGRNKVVVLSANESITGKN